MRTHLYFANVAKCFAEFFCGQRGGGWNPVGTIVELSINNSVDLSMTAMTTRSTVHGVHRTCGHELLPLLLVIGFPPPIISYSLYIYIERVYTVFPIRESWTEEPILTGEIYISSAPA